MVRSWLVTRIGAAVLVLALAFGGCNGNVAVNDDANGNGTNGNGPETLQQIPDDFAPCTDPTSNKCCLEDELICKDPDEGGGCSCVSAWVCESLPNPEKCWRTPPVPQFVDGAPNGSTAAQCVWSEFEYRCTGQTTPPGEGGSLPGGAGWTSKWTNEETGEYESAYDYPPNPSNKPEGVIFYSCVIDQEMTKLTCKPAGAETTPRAITEQGPPLDDFDKVDEGGTVVWRREGGLPFSGEGTCKREVLDGQLMIVCRSNNPPDGETGYQCEEVNELGYAYRCARPATANDVPNENNTAPGEAPSGDANFTCVDTTEFNRTDCYESPPPPVAPTGGEHICYVASDESTAQGTPLSGVWAEMQTGRVIYDGVEALHVRFKLDRGYVDNTYGDYAVKYQGGPTNTEVGGGHSFRDLVESDKLEIFVSDSKGDLLQHFAVDYISPDPSAPSGYSSLGVNGGEGTMLKGSADDILDVRTSLDYNFNTLGYELTQNSPKTDVNYTPDPAYPGWIFDVWYEVWIKWSAYGADGPGRVYITGLHASPNKTGHGELQLVPGPCP